MSARSAIAVLAVVAALGLLVFGLLSKGGSGVSVGEAAPAPVLPQLEGGGKGSLAEYRGRWVLVNFWASWCGPCREEAPALERFQREHGGTGFTVLGIDSRDLSGDGRAFVRRYHLSYPQLRDRDGDTAHAYGTSGVPENFLVDPRGKVRWFFRGPVTPSSLDEVVGQMLPRTRS